MKVNIALGVITLILVSSCVNTKKLGTSYVFKKQKVYKIESGFDSSVPTQKQTELTLKKGAVARISASEDKKHLKLKFLNSPEFISNTITKEVNVSRDYTYYPGIGDKENIPAFKYLEIYPIFQAITIPFKVQPGISNVPYQVTKGVNLGFAYGSQFTFNSYKTNYSKKLDLTYVRTNSFSVTPAAFFGPTTIDLKPSNTDNFLAGDKTVFGLNGGALLVFGVNRFNLGGAVGFDYGFGNGSKKWVYNGKPWFGFVLALDFIK